MFVFKDLFSPLKRCLIDCRDTRLDKTLHRTEFSKQGVINGLISFILDLFFPIQCFGCGKEGKWICSGCIGKIKINSEVIDFSEKQSQLSGLFVASDYRQDLLKSALKAFKYNFASSVGYDLSELLLIFLRQASIAERFSRFDLVIPVPLTKKRNLWRGFNQSEILAGEVCAEFSWSLGLNVLGRKSNVRPQVGLNAKERLANVRGVFYLKNANLLKGRIILLIDDVFTTGATMQECAKILKQGGAVSVWGLVLAKNQA